MCDTAEEANNSSGMRIGCTAGAAGSVTSLKSTRLTVAVAMGTRTVNNKNLLAS